MFHEAPNINHLWSRILVEELRRNGVDTFYISPGSRSTPLTMAAAQTDGVKTYVHFDERGAAFAAMGHALGSERPTALICTSGTAAANYLPAIVEASYSGIPLIVLTADRPPELTDAGANQAINQIGLYRNFTRWEHALPCPTTEMPATALLTAIDQACYRANGNDPGAVHINCPFREPLAPTPTGDDWTNYLAPIERWIDACEPFTKYSTTQYTLAPGTTVELHHLINQTQRGVVVVGRLIHQSDRDAAAALVKSLNWPCFADITSGLRLQMIEVPYVTMFDMLLSSAKFKSFCQPDTVLHIGGGYISKRLLQHLDSVRPKTYIHLARSPRRIDPIDVATHRIVAPVNALNIAARGSNPSGDAWLEKHFEFQATSYADFRRLYNRDGRVSELGVMELLTLSPKADSAFLFGNSMPVRDADAVSMVGTKEAPFPVAANRGASGIDGNIATAVGYARGLGRPVTAVLGDLAVLHDLNSLALLHNANPRVTLYIINNNGGGVFHFLPVAGGELFEEYFGTPHGLDFANAAAQFGLEYCHAETMDSFKNACVAADTSTNSMVIEVRTDRHENHQLHLNVLEVVRKALDGSN